MPTVNKTAHALFLILQHEGLVSRLNVPLLVLERLLLERLLGTCKVACVIYFPYGAPGAQEEGRTVTITARIRCQCCLTNGCHVRAVQITDADILNFALNLEYLEAEFYNCAVTGSGLPATLRGGGPASIGCQKANITGDVLVLPRFRL